MLFEVLVEVSFLTGDRLDLDDLVNPLILGDLGDDAVGLLAVPGPVDVNAIRSQVLLRLDEVMVEPMYVPGLSGAGVNRATPWFPYVTRRSSVLMGQSSSVLARISAM